MKTIKSKISSFFRPYRNKKRQKFYLKKYGSPDIDFNILSNNCIGGMCYHDAAKPFLSPTINLSIDNFLVFVSNLNDYLSCQIEQVKDSGKDYPVGLLIPKNSSLPPIKIHFVHYETFDIAKNKWIERSQRMFSNKGNVCIIYCVPSGEIIDENKINLFNKIKAYRKLCFYREANVTLPQNSKDTYFVKIPEKYQSIDYSKYVGLFSRKRYYDYFFDIYKFIFTE